LRHATNATEFKLRVDGIESASDGGWRGFQKGAGGSEGMPQKKSQHFNFDS
jgi:hypothetical protein